MELQPNTDQERLALAAFQVAVDLPIGDDEEHVKRACGGDAVALTFALQMLDNYRKRDARKSPEVEDGETATNRPDTPPAESAGLYREFKEQLEDSKVPDITEFLERVPKEHRGDLLGELIRLEYADRWQKGELPTLAEYVQRFPDEGHRTRDALFTSRPGGPKYVLYDSKPLGEGSFGTVYKARSTARGHDVAVKILGGASYNRIEPAQFLNEFRTVASIRHPGIVPVHDYDCFANGVPFFVMDCLSRGTLAEVLKNAPCGLEPDRAAKLMITIARAVHAAHESGDDSGTVVHCDLKPANILLDEGGEPHVSDFGVAATVAAIHQGTASIGGTPAYASPELLRRRRGEPANIDRRSDVWSLGVTLYELLTGKRPFLGYSCDYVEKLIERERPTAPVDLNRKVPHELERIVLVCLEKEQDKRFRTAEKLAVALEQWLQDNSLRNYAAIFQKEVATFQLPFEDSRPIGDLLPLRFVQRETLPRATPDSYMRASPAKGVKSDVEEDGGDAEDEDQQQPEKAISSFSIDEVVSKSIRSWIVGPSGSGKSAQLDALAHSLCSDWLESPNPHAATLRIPVRVDARLCSDGLIAYCNAFLSARIDNGDSQLDAKTTHRWLQEGQLLLLIDYLDEIGEESRKQVLTRIADIAKQYPRTSIILVSQLAFPPELREFTRYDVAPLKSAQVLRIFTAHCGEVKGQEAFLRLREAGAIEPFLLPIHAWFLAMAYDSIPIGETHFCPGIIYKRILEDGLRQFFEERDGMALGAEAAITFLARLAHRMNSLRQADLSDVECLTISPPEAALTSTHLITLIKALASTGVLIHSAGRVSFRHPTYRSYFCAVQLRKSCSAREVFSLSSDPSSKDVLRFFVGITDEAAASEFLNYLFKWVRRRLWILRTGPSRTVSGRLFVLLWCLSDAVHQHCELKDRLVRCLRGGVYGFLLNLWFGRSTGRELHLRLTPDSLWEYPRIVCENSRVYTVFVALIARFKTPAADRYIDARLFGGAGYVSVDRTIIYCQKRTDEMIDALLADFDGYRADGEPHPLETKRVDRERATPTLMMKRALRVFKTGSPAGAEENIVYALFESPISIVVPKVRSFLGRADRSAVLRFLRAVEVGCSWVRSTDDIFDQRAGDRDEWLRLFCEVRINHPDEQVRDAALSTLRAMSRADVLPRFAEQYFLLALDDSDEEVQCRALWPLAYAHGGIWHNDGACEELVPRLRRMLTETEGVYVRLKALQVLYYHPGFAGSLAIFLTTLQSAEVEDFVERQTAALASEHGSDFVGQVRVIAVLIAGYKFTNRLINTADVQDLLRQWCVRALGQFQFQEMTGFLRRVFEDLSEVGTVRAEALCWVCSAIEDWDQKAPLLSFGLADPASDVREHAAYRIWQAVTHIVDGRDPKPPTEVIQSFRMPLERLAAGSDGRASEYAGWAIAKMTGSRWPSRASQS